MTLEHDIPTADLFGLAGTFPRPGWVVLDAARDRRFTGEIVFDTVPRVQVYLDRGNIYLAERVTDPSLGARLVDAGALNAAQLEHGSLRIADDEHLGRLFERVPSVDRHAVLITAELMTEECVGWLAHQRVGEVESTPYRHHPSGVHRWDRVPAWPDLAPGDPLPAPGPYEQPVEVASPEPLFGLEGAFNDDMIRWDEPSWLDERPSHATTESPSEPQQPTRDEAPGEPSVFFQPPSPPAPPSDTAPVGPLTAQASAPAGEAGPIGADDWVDRLESDGLPDVGADPLASTKGLPNLPVEPADRFEVIWPTGEIDEQFGATDVAEIDDQHPDLDRAGPTALVMRTLGAAPTPFDEPPAAPEVVDVTPDDGAAEGLTDEVVLAVRRAVASIETGSLSTRRRLVDTPPDDTSRGSGPPLPARVALRNEFGEWAQGVAAPPTRSVFDDLPVEISATQPQTVGAETAAAAQPDGESAVEAPERASALRRLIGSLRRR